MERQLPAPDVHASEVPLGTLDGTAASIAAAALKAGYTVRATRALGPRVPKLKSQPVERQATLAIVGVMHGWAFTACHSARDGWDILERRPGWPETAGNIDTLRARFKAQTPVELGSRSVSRVAG